MSEPIHVRARKFLQEFFNDEELTTFCFDNFHEVYNDFTQGMPKNQKIVRLVSFCRRRNRLNGLLAALEKERSEQYRTHFVENPQLIGSSPQIPEMIENNSLQTSVESLDQVVEVANQDSTSNNYSDKQAGKLWSGLVSRYQKLDIVEKILSIMASIAAIITFLWALNIINFPASSITTTVVPTNAISSARTTVMLSRTPLLIATVEPSKLPAGTKVPTSTADPNLLPVDAELGDRWTRPIDGIEMVFVPSGTFLMGSDSNFDSSANGDEFPQRQVMISSFWIDRTEVTNAQFSAFLNALGNQVEDNVTWLDIDGTGSKIEFNGMSYTPKVGFANHPVGNVSWHGATAYCEWAGAMLPTEAQWEYAARGSDGRMYPWGNEEPTCQLTEFVACSGSAVEVSTHSPDGDSWVGAVDMAGNLWEWVDDWYSASYYRVSLTNDPSGPETGSIKVYRGGQWGSGAQNLRVAVRSGENPDYRNDSVGFRCALFSEN